MTDDHLTGLHWVWRNAQVESQTLDSRFDAISRFLGRRAARRDFDAVMKASAISSDEGQERMIE